MGLKRGGAEIGKPETRRRGGDIRYLLLPLSKGLTAGHGDAMMFFNYISAAPRLHMKIK